MDVKYIGGDAPWSLPFGDHFYSASQASFTDTTKTSFISASDLDTIARRHDFEPLYSTKETQTKSINSDHNSQWMNAGVLFTDKKIEPDVSGIHKTDYTDDHGHTFCYLCSINQHDHERTKPRDQSQRRKLIPYNNPKALKARSSSLDRLHDPNAAHLVPYRFIVRTGTGKNCGTRAKVFLYIYGTENNWTSVGLHSRANANIDGFPSGSIRTFCLKGPEIGQLHHLNVNLVGAHSDKAWYLKEIEITNLNTTVTWLCEFNCWLPKKGEFEDERNQVKPSLHPQKELALENLSVYILQVRTGGKAFAGTDSNIHVLIRGSTGQTRRLALTSNRANLFEQNQLDTFAIVGWDIGDLLEMTVDSDRSQMAADWDLREMLMWKIMPSHDHKQVQVYFPFNAWLGKKTSTLKAKKDSYSPAEYHPRGPTCYQIAVKTGKKSNAGTDANVFIIIYGKNGRTIIHELDNPGINDFERNSTSEFTIMDSDVGEIDRIKIWHDNSGAGPGWYLESVIIRKKHSTCRQLTNIFIQRLEQTSKALYRQARDHLQKINKSRASSPKENDRSSLQSRDYDDLGSNRGILRSPIPYDKANLQKKVRWDEHSMGSQDGSIPIDTKRMKNMQKDVLSQQIETGHFEHHAHWISTHNYHHKKWEIQSIEEQNSLHFDESIRLSLLQDRTVSSSKIKSVVNERDDDVYEFEANRWLALDEGDHKIEVYLTPKSTKLSTQTSSEPKWKPSSDLRYEKYEKEHSERSPRDTSKTHIDNSRSPHRSQPTLSNPTKRLDEPSTDKYYRPESRSSKELYTSSAGGKDSSALMSSQSLQQKYQKEHSERSSRFDQGPSERSSHDTSKTHIDNSRSSQRSQPSPSIPSKRLDESSMNKYYRPESRSSKELYTLSAGGKDLSALMSSQSFPERYTKEHSERSSKFDQGPSDRSPRDTSKTHIDNSRSSQRSQPSPSIPSKRLDESSMDKYYRPESRSSKELYTSSAGGKDLSALMSSQSFHDRYTKEHSERSSKFDLGPLDRSPRDTSKTHIDNSRSPQRSQPSLSTPSKRPDESSIDKYYRPESRSSKEPYTQLTAERDLAALMSNQSSYHSRPAASSAIDPRSSSLANERSKSSRFNNEPSSPLVSNRDLSSKTPAEPSSRPKSAVRPTNEFSSSRATRNDIYSSAYGTIPMDNF